MKATCALLKLLTATMKDMSNMPGRGREQETGLYIRMRDTEESQQSVLHLCTPTPVTLIRINQL